METLLTIAAIFSSNLEQSYSSYHLILPTVRIFVNVTILSPIVRWKHCYSYDVIILYDWWSKQNWAYFSVSKRRSCQKLSFQSALCLIIRKNIKHIRPKLFVFSSYSGYVYSNFICSHLSFESEESLYLKIVWNER